MSCYRSVIASFIAAPSLGRRFHPRFRVHTETFRDAIDVIEIANYLDGDRYLIVGEAHFLKRANIVLSDCARPEREHGGKITQGAILSAQGRLPIVKHQLLGDLFVSGFRTEILRV